MKRQRNGHKGARVLQFGWICSLEEQSSKPDDRQIGGISLSGTAIGYMFSLALNLLNNMGTKKAANETIKPNNIPHDPTG